MRKQKQHSRKQPNELNSLIATIEPFDPTLLLGDPFLNQNWDDLLLKDELAMTLPDPFFDPIATIEPFDLDPLAASLGDKAPDPIAILLDDPLLDPELLEATMKSMVDDELVKLDLNWWLAQIEDEKSILFATFETMQATFDLDRILSSIRDFANCPSTFAEDATTQKR